MTCWELLMSNILAIDLSGDEIRLLRLLASKKGPVQIARSLSVSREAWLTPGNGDSSSAPENAAPDELKSFLSEEYDAAYVALAPQRTVFHSLELPFSEPKRVFQVAPLQLQDLVPFEVDDFVVDALVGGKNESGDYQVLSSLYPRADVAAALQLLTGRGIQPRTLTTKSSAISGLRALFPAQLSGTFALMSIEERNVSLAVYVNDELRLLREIPVETGVDGFPIERQFLDDVRCALGRAGRDSGTDVEQLFAVGWRGSIEVLADSLGVRAQRLTLGEAVFAADGQHIKTEEAAWAAGVAASHEQKGRLIEFRRGEFAYKPTFGAITEAVREQGFYFILLFVCLAAWLGASIISTSSRLSEIDEAMEQNIRTVMPDAEIPEGRQVEFINGKVKEIEDRLREMGTLSPLSPLESLKELSTVIDGSVDIALDTLSIGHSRISMSGSVLNFPTVGKLSDALEKRTGRFCDVKVDPKGQASGSTRVRFSADIKLCE